MNRTIKLLVSRIDKLGDVLLSLPALQLLRQSLPNVEIDFRFKREYMELLQPFLVKENIDFVEFDAKRIRPLVKTLIGQNYRGFLNLFSEPKFQIAARFARVPYRIGNRSKPVSWFTMNKYLTQQRSLAQKNEAEYNLELSAHLIQSLGFEVSSLNTKVILPVNHDAQRKVLERFEYLKEKKPFIVIHPGSGGSAENLSPKRYGSLMKSLNTTGEYLLSVGPAENDRKIKEAILQVTPMKVVENLSLVELGELFRLAKCVVAPSTGPLHLAHYVGIETLGFFPPVQSQKKERWAPWGGIKRSRFQSPEDYCQGKRNCIGPSCQSYYCMDKMRWEDWLKPLCSEFLQESF